MGAKKKGKGSKLSRMSEEERLRYLQHRAAIEEEAKRRKEQLVATFMKNKLKREEAFSRLNMAKINQQWRQTLRRYKCGELRQDLEALFKWFVHIASKKTKQIDILLDDLDEAERQYSRIHQCHMETVDSLLDIHKQRINFFQRQYEEDRKEIYEKATNEMREIVESSTSDQDHLKAILFLMEESQHSKESEMKAKQMTKADELRNTMLTELENLAVSREVKIEQLWQSIQGVLKNYWEETEDRRRQYVTLRDADFENCKQIFFYYQQINNANDTIMGLKHLMVRTRTVDEEKFNEVRREKEEWRRLYKSIKKEFDEDREKDRKTLAFLTVVADDATRALTAVERKGDRILQLLSLCKKLELLRDKICPYMQEKSYLSEDQERVIAEEGTRFREELAEEVVTNFSKLDNFWKRYNQVLIEKEAIALNIKAMEIEQKELKNALRSYLSEAVISKPSTKIQLTVHRPFTSDLRRTSIAPQRRKALSSVPYVEAAQASSIRHMIRLQTAK